MESNGSQTASINLCIVHLLAIALMKKIHLDYIQRLHIITNQIVKVCMQYE